MEKTTRNMYTPLEDREMWLFVYKKLKEGEIAAKYPCGLKIWEQYVKESHTNKTASSLNSHFRKQLANNLHEADITKKTCFFIMKELGYILDQERVDYLRAKYKVDPIVSKAKNDPKLWKCRGYQRLVERTFMEGLVGLQDDDDLEFDSDDESDIPGRYKILPSHKILESRPPIFSDDYEENFEDTIDAVFEHPSKKKDDHNMALLDSTVHEIPPDNMDDFEPGPSTRTYRPSSENGHEDPNEDETKTSAKPKRKRLPEGTYQFAKTPLQKNTKAYLKPQKESFKEPYSPRPRRTSDHEELNDDEKELTMGTPNKTARLFENLQIDLENEKKRDQAALKKIRIPKSVIEIEEIPPELIERLMNEKLLLAAQNPQEHNYAKILPKLLGWKLPRGRHPSRPAVSIKKDVLTNGGPQEEDRNHASEKINKPIENRATNAHDPPTFEHTPIMEFLVANDEARRFLCSSDLEAILIPPKHKGKYEKVYYAKLQELERRYKKRLEAGEIPEELRMPPSGETLAEEPTTASKDVPTSSEIDEAEKEVAESLQGHSKKCKMCHCGHVCEQKRAIMSRRTAMF